MKNIEYALNLKFHSGDLDRIVTIREYLKELLMRLFDQGESFSGKRPFGNSGWDTDLAAPLIDGGWLNGTVDNDGCAGDFEEGEYHALVAKIILAL